MRFRKPVGAVALTAAAIAVCAVNASPASATTWDHTWYTTDDNPGGRIQIAEYNDDIKLCDIQGDGKAVFAEISWDTGGGGGVGFELDVTQGNGSCAESTAASHNLPENVDIYVHIGLGSSGSPQYDYASYFLNDH